MLVYQSSISAVFWDCPFIIRDRNEIDTLLENASCEDLLDHIDTVLQSLSPYELLHARQHDFMSGSGDFPGAALFIKDLWESQVIGILRIPQLFKNNAHMRKWLFAYEGLEYLLKKPELENQSKKAAVTDGLAESQKQETLNNPRWEHKDAERAKSSPDVAAVGDSVLLIASAQGFDDGAGVAFDLFDASGGSPEKIETVGGKVEAGRAEASWIVADPKKAGDKLDLQFEASAKDMRTEKAPIKTKFVFDILLQIDVDDPKAKDDVLILLDENNAEVKKLPVKDMKEISEDIVRIVIEDIKMDKKYTLVRDYGAEDDGGHDPLFVQLTPRELMKFSKDPSDKDQKDADDKVGEDSQSDGEGTGGENSESSDSEDSGSSNDSWELIESNEDDDVESADVSDQGDSDDGASKSGDNNEG